MSDSTRLTVSAVRFGLWALVFLLFPQLVLALEERLYPGEVARMRKKWGRRRSLTVRLLGVVPSMFSLGALALLFGLF